MPSNNQEERAASCLKEEGNRLFKSGDYKNAFLKYNAAFRELAAVDGGDAGGGDDAAAAVYQRAVLLSNRSNCLFEMGKYGRAIADARKCLELLLKCGDDTESEPTMAVQVETLRRKNLLRIARGGFYGENVGCSGSFAVYQDNVVEPLQYLAQCGEPLYEKRAKRMIEEAELRRKMLLSNEKGDTDAELPPLPSIHRASLHGSSVCEYYNYGHDMVSSALMEGDPGEGSDEPSCPAIVLSKLPDEHLSSLSFLFGGVGDARHVYTTICDAHSQWQQLTDRKKEAFQLKIALNDINPAVLARDALIMALIVRLGECAPDLACCEERGSEAFRVATMLEYTFWGYTCPPVVHDNLMEFIDYLIEEDFASLKSLVVASDTVWSQIKKIMLYWRKVEEGEGGFPTTPKVLKEFYRADLSADPNDLYVEGSEAFERVREIKDGRKEENRQRKEDMLQEIESATLDEFPPGSPLFTMMRSRLPPSCSDEEVLDKLKDFLKMQMEDMDPDDMDDAEKGKKSEGRFLDDVFAKEANALLPPRGCAGGPYDDIWEARYHRDACMKIIEEAKGDIKTTWKVNRTMFDPVWTDFMDGNFDPNQYNPVEDVGADFLLSRGSVLGMFSGEELTMNEISDLDFFQCSTLFFWNTAHSLRNLRTSEKVSFDFSIGPVTSLCRELLDDSSTDGPKKFHRIFLSNVPDYIGMLSVMTDILPLLHRQSKAVPTFLQSNVLLHTGIWRDFSQYFYSATGIPSFGDAETLVGIKHLTSDSVWLQQNQWTWPKACHPKANREQVTLWLHHVLLTALLPPERDPYGSTNEQCTTNVASFLRLCTFCIETLSYPAHWVGSVIDDLVAACSTGAFKTKAAFPTITPAIHRSSSKLQRVDLRAFQVEIKSQVELWSRRTCKILSPLAAPSEFTFGQFNKYSLPLGKEDGFLKIKGCRERAVGVGGWTYCLCLGFVLSKLENPDGFDASHFEIAKDFFPRGPHMGDGMVRTHAIKGTKDFQVFSCMDFVYDMEGQKHSIAFYMNENDFNRYAGHYIHLIRTDSWNQLGFHKLSSQMRLRDAVKVPVDG